MVIVLAYGKAGKLITVRKQPEAEEYISEKHLSLQADYLLSNRGCCVRYHFLQGWYLCCSENRGLVPVGLLNSGCFIFTFHATLYCHIIYSIRLSG